MPDYPTIADLRWPVALAKREQIPDPDSTGVLEPLRDVVIVNAKIEAARPVTFYEAAQTDSPFTHMVWIRWLDWLDTSHVIIRDMRRPDGTSRREVFRIRRLLEMNGRQRFLQIEAELEHRE